MEGEKGNFMVVGETGGGKAALSFDVVRKRVSAKQHGDWLQLRRSLQHNKDSGEQHYDNK